MQNFREINRSKVSSTFANENLRALSLMGFLIPEGGGETIHVKGKSRDGMKGEWWRRK